MKISKKAFLAFNMHEEDKKNLVSTFMDENNSLDRLERFDRIQKYISPAQKTYLLTKTAIDTINNVKFKNNEDFRQMLIENADLDATILIDKFSYFRYYIDVDGGIACMHIKFIPVDNEEIDKVTANKMKKAGYNPDHANKQLKYEAFKIRRDELYHPDLDKGREIPEIEFFLKALVFIKCTNTQVEVLSPRKAVRTKINNEKFVLEVDQEVTLVNSKFNQIIIRNEQFWVNPHGRFQRHGPERKLVKYIIIDGYYKNGYKRGFK